MRPIPPQAETFLIEHEAEILRAYPDPATGGAPWTIGIGHTGPEVHRGLVITEAVSRTYLRQDLDHAGRLIYQRIGPVTDELTDNQYAALLSFVFNLGCDASWTIWRVLRARQFDQVPVQLMRFVNAGGRKLQGLVNRRTAEVRLWSTAEPGSAPADPPSSLTRGTPTPPTPMQPQSLLATSRTVWAGAGTAAAGVLTGLTQVQGLVAPQAGASHFLAQAAGILAVAVVALGVLVMVLRALDHHAANT